MTAIITCPICEGDMKWMGGGSTYWCPECCHALTLQQVFTLMSERDRTTGQWVIRGDRGKGNK